MHVVMWALGLPFVARNEERKRRWNSRLLVAAQTGEFIRQPKGMRYGS